MSRRLATDISGASSPFGAAHRVYLDTPPLEGWRSLPIGSERERKQNDQVINHAVANGICRYRHYRCHWREFMATKTLTTSDSETLQRPAVRSRQIGVRLTEEEYSDFEKAAWKSGKTIGDWARERLLAQSATADAAVTFLMTEIIGLELFLTDALSPVVCGEHMSAEQYENLMRNVKTTKRRAAQAVIAQYVAEKQEASHA
jgi:hypothetical protein